MTRRLSFRSGPAAALVIALLALAAPLPARAGGALLWLKTEADLTPQHDELVAVACEADAACQAQVAGVRLTMAPSSLFRCSRAAEAGTTLLTLHDAEGRHQHRREVSDTDLRHGIVVRHFPEPGRYVRIVLVGREAPVEDTLPQVFAARPSVRMRIHAPEQAARVARERGLPG